MDKLKILGWVYAGLSTIGLLGGAGLCAGLLFERDPRGVPAFEFIFPLFLMAAAVILLPAFIGGIGLIVGRAWARIPVVIASLALLFLFPFGTVLAVAAFWVLYDAERTSLSAATAIPKAVPPSNDVAPRAPFALSEAVRKELKNATGVLLAMLGVGSAFIVAIDGGFRINQQQAPAPLDALFYPAVAIFVLVCSYALYALLRSSGTRRVVRAGGRWLDRGKLKREREFHAEERRQRLARLAADPKTHRYAELIEKGQAWNDDQIAYDLDPARTATCVHLAAIERAMRDAGLQVKLLTGANVQSGCLIDQTELAEKFHPFEPARYVEFVAADRSLEDPPGAAIACGVCQSTIRVIHRVEANAQTPLFPSPSA